MNLNSTHETCVICINDYAYSFCHIVTKCNHKFHHHCFYSYSMDKIKSTSVINCPICQTDLIDYSIGGNDTQHGYTFYTYLIQRRQENLEQDIYECPYRCTVS